MHRSIVFAIVIGFPMAASEPTEGQTQGPPESVVSKSTGIKLNLIPAGRFLMGSTDADVEAYRKADRNFHPDYPKDEQPAHSVEISKSFYLGVYEVTQREYQQVSGTNPSVFSKTDKDREDVEFARQLLKNEEGFETIFDEVTTMDTSRFPVDRVSWYEAIEFCNMLSVKDGLEAHYKLSDVRHLGHRIESSVVTIVGGNGYRLPTEAEWEYACRASTTTPFHFGDELNGDKANVNGTMPYGTSKAGVYLKRTTTVGSFPDMKNAFGLFDMHGNVREWCFDADDERAYEGSSATDPIVTKFTRFRVLRGGAWVSMAGRARSAARNWHSPQWQIINNGFRIARDSSGVSAKQHH